MNTPSEMNLEWSGLDLIKARRLAARKLHLKIRQNTPNSFLCRRLALPADHLRPQRLIHWAKQRPNWGQA